MVESSSELPQPTVEQLVGSFDASKPEKKGSPHVVVLRAIEDTELTALRNEAVRGDPAEKRPPKPVNSIQISASFADQLRHIWEREAPSAFTEEELSFLGDDVFLGGLADGGHTLNFVVPKSNAGFERFRTDFRIFLDAACEAVALEQVSDSQVKLSPNGARNLLGRMIRARHPSASIGYYERQSPRLASEFQRAGYLDDKNLYLFAERGFVGLTSRGKLRLIEGKLEKNATAIAALYNRAMNAEGNDYKIINSEMLAEVRRRVPLKLAYGGIVLKDVMSSRFVEGGMTRLK